jgi:enediyne polyketide synthase
MAEAASLSGLVECSYDTLGIRREPRLELLPPVGAGRSSRLTARDLLLVSGGGKGIAAECALALARDSRCRLVLMGRSNPDSDRELALNLARFAVSNVEFRYKQADVTNIAEVRNSLRAVQEEWGLITAVLHGAGTNLPKRIEQLSVQDIRITLAPKVDGLRNILSSIDAASLTTLITFGSIIARTGMPGEADYALANAAMGQLAEEWQARYPHCRCLNLEWSVWAGTGMGQRLGVIDSLKRQGISPISVDQGIRMLQAALERDDLPVSTIITSRFSNQNTLRVKEAKLPFLRFVDETRLHYPGVELVIEAQLSISNDPYLEDHALEGERIFPAVMGMEAMAQVASALHGSSVLPQFRNVWLKRPIIVTEREPLRIRIAALQRAPGHVSIAIRSAETSFQVDHFLAECVFEGGPLPGRPWIQGRVPGQEVAVNPNADLYSGILFHKGRFRRVGRYCALTADHSIAEIVPVTSGNWFGHHFPQTLCLGDPAARDAVVHSVQACVPQAPLMPVSVERITLNNTWAERPVEARAKEREKENGVYVYDLEVVDTAGQVCERWEGIRYKAVKCADRGRPLLPALLAPFLQRGFEETLGEGRVRIAIANGTGEQSTRTKRAITILGGEHACVVHRPDGRPELVGQPEAPPISISHADNLTFAATSVGTIGCDIESVAARKHEDWRLLLGPEGWKLAEFLAGEMEERVDASATCVWAARESLTKAGSLPGLTPLFSRAGRDGWLSFSAGSMTGACCIASVCGQRDPLAFALALEKSHARI